MERVYEKHADGRMKELYERIRKFARKKRLA